MHACILCLHAPAATAERKVTTSAAVVATAAPDSMAAMDQASKGGQIWVPTGPPPTILQGEEENLGDKEGPRLGAYVASPQLNHSEGHSCYREFLPILRTLGLISKSANVPYDLCE